jgi:hypothetical protein
MDLNANLFEENKCNIYTLIIEDFTFQATSTTYRANDDGHRKVEKANLHCKKITNLFYSAGALRNF